MRVETVTRELYSFDELEDDAQDKAVENLAEINVIHDWWDYDGLLGLTAQEMKDRHITMSDRWWESDKPKNKAGNIIGEYPAYTGLFTYDKLFFDINRDNYIQFQDLVVNDGETFRKFLRIPKRLWEVCDWWFETPTGYNYQGPTRLRVEPDKWDERSQDYTEFTEHQQSIVDRAVDIMKDKIDEALSSLSNTYDYLTSEEGIIETIKAYDHEFTAEGNVA